MIIISNQKLTILIFKAILKNLNSISAQNQILKQEHFAQNNTIFSFLKLIPLNKMNNKMKKLLNKCKSNIIVTIIEYKDQYNLKDNIQMRN